jgi:heme exporter protein A
MRLRADNIAVDRGGRRLFCDLSFEVKSGEALIVLGPNGAGKTSLLRAIAGLLALAAGALAADGDEDEATLGERAHYLGHADALKSALTAGENLEFWAEMLAPPREDRLSRQREQAPAPLKPMTALAALDRLGLGHVLDFPVHALSAGQKRRVALARLLAAERPLWLLDEPLTALDQAAQARFTEIMRQHLGAGGLIVAATHAPLALDGARELRLGAASVSP